MKEYGRIGQNRWDGMFSEEFLPELRGLKGIKVYKEMANNDSTIGSILFAIKMLCRQAPWSVEPGGDSAKDKEAAEFVESCMNDMSSTWTDTISEILSFLTYGWSFHEIVYKRRNGKKRDRDLSSKYSDGLIGWEKLPIRSQDTLYRWEYDDNDNLVGMTQQPPPKYELLTIPMRKALLFRTESAKDNPEGRSILRNCYRDWYFKRRILEIEAIGIERDLAGLPVIHTPEGLDIWDKDDTDAQNIYATLVTMIKNVRRNEYEGLVLPFGYDFELTSTGGTRQFDTNAVIQRYNVNIAQTVMADFLMLGHEGTGSFALSADKTTMFTTAIGTFLDIICEVFNNQGIPSLIDINGSHFNGITDYPQLTHGAVGDVDITQLSTMLKDLISVGVIVPDEGLEDYVRDVADLPERSPVEDDRSADPRRESQRRQPEQTGNDDMDGEDTDDAEDDDAPAPSRSRPSGSSHVDPDDNQDDADEDTDGDGSSAPRRRSRRR